MLKQIRTSCAGVLATILMVAGVGASDVDDDRRFTRLTAPIETDDGGFPSFEQQGAASLKRFFKLWSDTDYDSEVLKNGSDEFLLLRLQAASWTAFYNSEPEVLERFSSALGQADVRGLAMDRDYGALFDAYLSTGKFDAAKAMRQQYPDAGLPGVPERIEPTEASSESARIVWHSESEPLRMVGDVVELDRPRLLIVTSPGCGFCHRAARALAQDQTLGPLLEQHTLWVASQKGGTTAHHVAAWNSSFPKAPTLLVDDADQWPVADFFSFPQFVFVHGEQVEMLLVGWQGGSSALEAIAEGFIELGLLDQSDLPEDAFAYAD